MLAPPQSSLPNDAPALRFLRSDARDPPVTVIRDIRVKPGAEGRFELLMGVLIAEATQQPGHLGATVLRPTARPEAPSDSVYRFVYKFDKRSSLLDWHASPKRAELFQPITELILHDSFQEYPGLETWFDLPTGSVPPRWKTTLMSWAAIYVLVVAFSYTMRGMGLNLPIPLGALLLTGVIVPLVAYAIGPLLGRLLHGWLHA
jgi:antibiotic biosynthesis monooxygenase (ABM) superfamily enzyme